MSGRVRVMVTSALTLTDESHLPIQFHVAQFTDVQAEQLGIAPKLYEKLLDALCLNVRQVSDGWYMVGVR